MGSKSDRKKRIDKQEERLKKITARLDKFALQWANQESRIDALLEENQSTQQLSGNLEQQLSGLTEANVEFQGVRKHIQQTKDELESKISDLIDNLMNLREQQGSLTGDQSQFNQRLNDIEKYFTDRDTPLSELQDSLESISSRNQELVQKTEQLQSHILDVENSTSELAQSRDMLSEKTLSLEDTASRLAREQVELTEHTTRLDKQTEELATHKGSQLELGNEHTQLISTRLAELESGVNELHQVSGDLKRDIQLLEGKSAQLSEREPVWSEQIQAVEQQMHDLARDTTSVAGYKEELEKRLQALLEADRERDARFDQFTGQAQSLDDSADSLIKQVKGIESRIEILDQDMVSLVKVGFEERTGELKNQLATLQTFSEELKPAISDIKGQTETLQASMQSLQTAEEMLSEKVQHLETDKSQDEKVEAIASSIESLQSQVDKLESSEQQLTRDKQTIEQRLLEIVQENTGQRERIDSLNGAMEVSNSLLDEVNSSSGKLSSDQKSISVQMAALAQSLGQRSLLFGLLLLILVAGMVLLHIVKPDPHKETGLLTGRIAAIETKYEFDRRIEVISDGLQQLKNKLIILMGEQTVTDSEVERLAGLLMTQSKKVTATDEYGVQEQAALTKQVVQLANKVTRLMGAQTVTDSEVERLAGQLMTQSKKVTVADEHGVQEQVALAKQVEQLASKVAEHRGAQTATESEVEQLSGQQVTLSEKVKATDEHGVQEQVALANEVDRMARELKTLVENGVQEQTALTIEVDRLSGALKSQDEYVMQEQAALANEVDRLAGELKAQDERRVQEQAALANEVDRLAGSLKALEEGSKQKPTLPLAPQTRADKSWESARQSGQYTIQLIGVSKRSSLKAFTRRLQLSDDKLAILNTQNNGGNWYVLFYGSFKTLAQAKQQLSSFTPSLKELKPWIRRIPKTGQLQPLASISQ